jgi:hypothetical protein
MRWSWMGPVVQLFLDIGLDRPPCPLTLEREPDAVWYRCVNGCVEVTGQGEIIGLGVRSRLSAREQVE